MSSAAGQAGAPSDINMKPDRYTFLLLAPLGLLAFVASGCGAREPQIAAAMPEPRDRAEVPVAPVAPAVGAHPMTDRLAAAEGAVEAAAPRWLDLEGHTYANRAPFLAGVAGLEAVVTAQVAEVTARHAAMTRVPSTADSQAWDSAMKEMGDARSYLKSMGKEASEATADTWSQKKDKVGQAWVRSQAAYEKAKSTTG